jgi:flagellar motility protein MotE (MotC chaperone)
MDNYKDHFRKMKNQKLGKPTKMQGHKVKARRVSLNYKSNTVRSNTSGSYVWGGICLLGFALTLYGFLYPEKMSEYSSHIKIGFFTEGFASEAEKTAQDHAPKEEKKSPPTDPAKPEKKPEAAAAVEEKPSYVQGLMDKEKEFDKREKRLAELDEKLQQEKAELDKKIQALEQTRRDIASRLESRVAQDEENMNKLVGVYSNMKAQNAAQVISELDDELAINILKRMKKQDAANILNYIDAKKAKTLSEKYSGY